MGAAASASQAKRIDAAAAKKLAGERFDAAAFDEAAAGTGGVKVVTFLVPVKGKAGLDWGMDCCVSRVAPNGYAAKKGIQVGWRVYDVAGTVVKTKSQIADAISAARVKQKHNASKPFKITLLAPAGDKPKAPPAEAAKPETQPAAEPAVEPAAAAAAEQPAVEPAAEQPAVEPATTAETAEPATTTEQPTAPATTTEQPAEPATPAEPAPATTTEQPAAPATPAEPAPATEPVAAA